jgi:hypothetical protein
MALQPAKTASCATTTRTHDEQESGGAEDTAETSFDRRRAVESCADRDDDEYEE